MRKGLLQRKTIKAVITVMLAVLIAIMAISTTAFAVDTDGSFSFYEDAKYWNTNWKLWSQTSNNKPSNSYMYLYGCYVVAMSKLLVDAGIASSSKTEFNPGIFLKWEFNNGYINNGFYQQKKTVGGVEYNGATAYAKLKGKTLTYTSTSKRSEKDLLELLKTNYMIVGVNIYGNKNSTNHWIYVDRDKSISNNKVYYMDYENSQQAFAGKYADYYTRDVYLYPITTTKTESYNMPEGDYAIRNGSKYLSAPNDKDGGALTMVTSSASQQQQFTVKKSGSAYIIISKASSNSRVLNVYSDNVSASGMKVTLYKQSGDANQKWVFTKSGSGYMIHPSDNTNVGLALQSDGSLKLSNSKGANGEVWYLENINSAPSTTDAPTTEAPTTEAPTTNAPTTEAPTTEAPTTDKPAVNEEPIPIQDSGILIDTENKQIKNLSSQLKLEDFYALFENDNITVKDKNGNFLEAGQFVGSGAQLFLTDENGEAIGDIYTVIIKGDVRGTGEIKTADARKALRIAVKIDEPEAEWQKAAADVSGDGEVKTADARSILRVAIKIDKEEDWIA